jgi:hypothetical protein
VNDLVVATGLSPSVGSGAAGGVEEQMAVALRRLYGVLTAAGRAFEDVRRMVAYMAPGEGREERPLPAHEVAEFSVSTLTKVYIFG